ncbi:MAG: ABC transporter ATP-binding protein [Anaerolineaceae bacterium]|nr:ABC transporter ATP-binding protein [Anaerolineaceae bacterium]
MNEISQKKPQQKQPENELRSFIQIRGLRKTFMMGKQTVHALRNVDLDIEQGSFTVIMGPSGSGKSTLLYLLGGLDRPTKGEIYVNQLSLNQMDENALGIYRRRTVGFIFQSFNLIASMTALNNVIFPMRFARVSTTKRQERAKALLAEVGLTERSSHRPTELSGGQQQRVAIARALVNHPPLILADEPTGNLDHASGYAILKILSNLHHAGHTVVVVTHDQRMVRFASNVLYILDGNIVSEEEYKQASAFAMIEADDEGE